MKNLKTIAITGEFTNGKSTLINCLLHQFISKSGDNGLATTKSYTIYSYSENKEYMRIHFRDGQIEDRVCDFNLNADAFLQSDIEFLNVFLKKPILRGLTLIDTPGFGAEIIDDQKAYESLTKADCVIYIIPFSGLSSYDLSRISKIVLDYRLPCLVVMNCKSVVSSLSVQALKDCRKSVESTLSHLPLLSLCNHTVHLCHLGHYMYKSDFLTQLPQSIQERLRALMGVFGKNITAETSGFMELRDLLSNVMYFSRDRFHLEAECLLSSFFNRI